MLKISYVKINSSEKMTNSELIILGMIYFNPSHGYALKKNVKTYFGNPHYKLNNNILYSTLQKLEKQGYIIGKETFTEKINKKVYQITETGKKYLLELAKLSKYFEMTNGVLKDRIEEKLIEFNNALLSKDMLLLNSKYREIKIFNNKIDYELNKVFQNTETRNSGTNKLN